MAKRLSIQRLKKHHSYSVEEAAEAISVTPQTIRAWGNNGLSILKDQRPHLILGFVLIEYLKNRKTNDNQVYALDEFCCLRCRGPRKPFGMMADYIPINDSRGRLRGLCSVCETECSKFVSKADLSDLGEILSIVWCTE